jgi:hypothetical protein
LHGIEVRRRPTDGLGDPKASEVWLRRISVRYENGTVMSFVPEAKQEYFFQDEAERMVGILRKSSAWSKSSRCTLWCPPCP